MRAQVYESIHICRPELGYEAIAEIDKERESFALEICGKTALPQSVIEQVEIEIKYEGYIIRQKRQVEQYKKMEKKKTKKSKAKLKLLQRRLPV